MSGTVFSNFYWPDWLSDPGLRMSSLAARGLWMDMLCLMAQATPRGFLVMNGSKITPADLARIAGAPVDEVENLLAELERNEVFSQDRNGKIYSRRIIRDEKKAKTARKNGKQGGNPSLRKKKENTASDNQKPADDHKATLGPNGARPVASKPVTISHLPSGSQSPPLDWDQIEAKLRKAAGWESEPSPGLRIVGPIIDLIGEGADLDRDILATIRDRAPNVRRRMGWKYFIPAIRDAIQARLASEPKPNSKPIDWHNWTRNDYANAIFVAKRKGSWPEAYGPHDRIPPDLIDDELRTILTRSK